MPFSQGQRRIGRAMVFIDGTNLFHRLESAKLKLFPGAIRRLCVDQCAGDSRQRPPVLILTPCFGDRFSQATKVEKAGARILAAFLCPFGRVNIDQADLVCGLPID